MVEPKHVALQSISEDSKGRLEFYMYVQLEQGILTLEVIRNALQVVPYLKHFLLNTPCFNFDAKYIVTGKGTALHRSCGWNHGN